VGASCRRRSANIGPQAASQHPLQGQLQQLPPHLHPPCAVPVSGRVVVRSTVTAEDSGLAGSATITVTSSSRLSPSLYSCRWTGVEGTGSAGRG
jgi:hypothetical protein